MTSDRPLPAEQTDMIAADWFSRVRSGAMSDIEESALETWLDRDPSHQSAYDAVERTWNALELVRLHPRVLAMRDSLPARRPFRLSRYLPPKAIAASAAVFLAGAIAFGVHTTSAPPTPTPAGQFASHVYRTGAAERTVISLPDGSEVLLGENARLRTIADPSHRALRLEQGRAFFRVAKDATHPFVVQADGRTITAVGTAFEVRVDRGAVAVTLVEGRVRVQTPVTAVDPANVRTGQPARGSTAMETTEMVAGSRLAAGPQGWSVSRDDVDESTRWTRDQLVFEARPLAEVAAQMNLRSPRKIVVLDDAVGRTLISGNFRPGDVDGFAGALAAYNYASVATRADGSIEISHP